VSEPGDQLLGLIGLMRVKNNNDGRSQRSKVNFVGVPVSDNGLGFDVFFGGNAIVVTNTVTGVLHGQTVGFWGGADSGPPWPALASSLSGFDTAHTVLVHTPVNVTIQGFYNQTEFDVGRILPTRWRKTLINLGPGDISIVVRTGLRPPTTTLSLQFNIYGKANRTLHPNDGCRITWDPQSLIWQLNDGL
jgi:hypothetical protein